MSTTLLYQSFGLKHVNYLKTTHKEGKTFFHVEPKPEIIRCPTCNSTHVYKRGEKERVLRHVSIGRRPVFVHISLPRVQCLSCGGLRQITIPCAEPHKRYTRAFERYVRELCQEMTMEQVAHLLGVCWDTVKEIVKRHLGKRFGRPKLKKVRQIAIDEIAVGKGHDYMTVVMDLATGAILFVGDGKGADALKPFWKRLRGARSRIEAVALDMSPAYRAAVTKNLPKATMVYDRFHVVKLFNHNLAQLRRELYSQMKGRTERHMLKGIHWLLLKNPENLNEMRGEKERLEEALAFNQTLATAYYLKESLREQFWNCANYKEAARFLDEWIAEA
ncbi:MAG TPA: ISL3 family transposase, partial [Candidatus Hydrogenedentes bacterium]|nr:ISL3 family transposase [Candidatus Hydrogenedentota bacterium]